MKKILLVTILIISIFTFNSCSKNNSVNNVLTGNWSVVNDSSLNTNKFYTLSAGDSGISSSIYNGEQCGATFNFNPNGLLCTSFFNCIYGYGATIDSADYIVNDNQVTISIFTQGRGPGPNPFIYFNPLVTRTYTISNLTTNTVMLSFISIGESGTKSEIINLKR